jgi:hypothetical protein
MDSDKRQLYFSGRNKSMLLYNLRREFEPLNPGKNERLEKTLAHYMREVYAVKSDDPIPMINREVLTAAKADFAEYLNRAVAVAVAPSVKKPVATPATEHIFQDTGRALETLQQQRQGSQPVPPPIPDFLYGDNNAIVNEADDDLSPLELFEAAKKQREQLMPTAAVNTMELYRHEMVSPETRLAPPVSTNVRMQKLEPVETVMQGTLIREDSLVQYKETEQNLFVNSADRLWSIDGQLSMNRYNFTVNFDPANNGQSATATPSAQQKFRNIVRIELVKLIVPKETLDVLLQRTDATTPATNIQTNVLAFPSIVVQVSELDGNNYGTNNTFDRAFGIVHYDAQWSGDPAGHSAITTTATSTTTNGYVSLIPKFLKCQKVYEPTPLATLQKLSIRLERPDSGNLLSATADTVSVARIILGSGVTTSIYRSGAAPSSFIFVQTSTFFSRYMWEAGDRLRFAANAVPPGGTAAATSASIDALLQFINAEDGLLLVGVGYNTTGAPATVTDGQNAVGYANVLIFQNRFADPATGSTTAYTWGTEADMNTAFATATYSGNTINLNHQVQAVFRIITRDLDATTKLRPDNTY